MMGGGMMGWGMGLGMGILWILVLAVLVLGIAALIKYLRGRSRLGEGFE